MDYFSLNDLLDKLPKQYSIVAHETETLRSLYEGAELELETAIAKKSLELSALMVDEPVSGKDKKIKFSVDNDGDIFNLKMEVIKSKTNWKSKDIDAETINKQIMALCKRVDLFQTEMRMTGSVNKTNELQKAY